MKPFTAGNAITHFANVDAPKGFFWKYLLAYTVGIVVLLGLSYFTMRPLIDFYVEMFTLIGADPDAASDDVLMGELAEKHLSGILMSLLFMFILILPATLLFWAVFEAAIQRRYIRQDGFRLQLSADEFRLMVVGLVVILLLYVVLILATILLGIIVAATAATGNNVAVIIGILLGYILIFGAMLWYFARMSAASALTIRDRRIKLFESFTVTKGKVWKIAASLAVIWIASYIIVMIVYVTGIGVVIAQLSDLFASEAEPDAAAVFDRLGTPSVISSISIFVLLIYLTYGMTQIVSGGPGALAVLNDPRHPQLGRGQESVFD